MVINANRSGVHTHTDIHNLPLAQIVYTMHTDLKWNKNDFMKSKMATGGNIEKKSVLIWNGKKMVSIMVPFVNYSCELV